MKHWWKTTHWLVWILAVNYKMTNDKRFIKTVVKKEKKRNEIIFQIVVIDDKIGKEGATKMSELLITNTTLTELDLSDNDNLLFEQQQQRAKWNEMDRIAETLKWNEMN